MCVCALRREHDLYRVFRLRVHKLVTPGGVGQREVVRDDERRVDLARLDEGHELPDVILRRADPAPEREVLQIEIQHGDRELLEHEPDERNSASGPRYLDRVEDGVRRAYAFEGDIGPLAVSDFHYFCYRVFFLL